MLYYTVVAKINEICRDPLLLTIYSKLARQLLEIFAVIHPSYFMILTLRAQNIAEKRHKLCTHLVEPLYLSELDLPLIRNCSVVSYNVCG